jgi:hypothetical protein
MPKSIIRVCTLISLSSNGACSLFTGRIWPLPDMMIATDTNLWGQYVVWRGGNGGGGGEQRSSAESKRGLENGRTASTSLIIANLSVDSHKTISKREQSPHFLNSIK